MDKLLITGGPRLAGEIRISGAKNAALPLLCAALLTAEPLTFTNVPRLNDVRTMQTLLRQMGVGITTDTTGGITLDAATIDWPLAPYELVKTMRASILALGPLLARCGEARVSLPGGCAIGLRPVDQHVRGLQAMGAEIDVDHGYINARARRLRGARVRFDVVTVTGTENLLMAAALADGTTVLGNCALEPEVADLIALLQEMGADISGQDGETIVIRGQARLHGASHRVIPDRIEAGTYVIAGCFGGNDIRVRGVVPGHLRCLLEILKGMGADITAGADELHVKGAGSLAAADVCTEPYPGFPTDLQAQLTTLLTQAAGISRVRETIFNDRFRHAGELNRLGADIEIRHDTAIIRGPSALRGAELTTTDLRASAALVLGGLIAEGETVIRNSYQLFRGYEDMPAKLQKLGAAITISGE